MTRFSALAALLILPFLAAFPIPSQAAGESLEAIEKDLESILREMDALRSELDRLGELSALPKATGVRIEIARGGDVPPPASARLLLDGKAEEDREWTRPERDAFAGGSRPLVVQVPLVPGSYAGRVELSHPSWKAPPAVDLRITVKAGETARYRFRLVPAAGKAAPALEPDGGK